MLKSTKKRPTPSKRSTESLNETHSVKVDLPVWMIHALDMQADSLGISRKAAINVVLATGLSKTSKSQFSFGDAFDLKQLNATFGVEWNSKEDDEAFRDL